MESLTAADPRTVGEFRLRARLGAGGMGQVFLATSLGGRIVAVKVIHTELASDQEFVRRFRAEVDAARRVSGMYTAPVVAAGVDDRPPWLATAFVPGPALDKVVARHGPLPAPALWRLAAGLAEALRAIHSVGLIHRDLKPANVLLAADGPRVIDFGISRAASDSNTRLTATGSIIGTPSFMSPEQVEGRDAGPASDVFSLGSVLAFAASGTSPFSGGANVSSASVLYRVVHAEPDLARVPGDLRGLVEGCLAKDPARRPDLGQVAAICAAAAESLRLSPTAFWPPDVARVISEQAAGLNAQIDALQDGPGYPSGPAKALQDVPGWGSGMSTGPSRFDQPMTTQPPAQPPYWAPNGYQGFPPGGPMPGGSMPGGPARTPAYPLARPEYRGTSRRGVISGAVAIGVALVGGGAAWLVSSHATTAAGPQDPAATGPGLPTTGLPTGLPAAQAGGGSGAGTRKGAAWTLVTGNAVEADVSIANGVAYVGSKDDNVYAVNVATGKQVWKSPVGSVTAPPQVIGGVVCVATTTGAFTALKVADGTPVWQAKNDYPALWKPNWSADGGTVILFSVTGPLQAYDAATGNKTKVLGSQDLILATITAAGGVLYAMDTNGNLHAIRIASNSPVWQAPLGDSSGTGTGLTVSGGAIYAATQSGTLYSVNIASGRQNWKFGTGSQLLSAPVVADGKVYACDSDGNLHAVNVSDGKQAWRGSVTAGGVFGPAAGGGKVYATSGLVLQAYDAGSGTPSWYFQSQTGIPFASPAVADGTVVVGSSNGSVYGIRA